MKKVLKIILIVIMIIGIAFSAYNFISVDIKASSNVAEEDEKKDSKKSAKEDVKKDSKKSDKKDVKKDDIMVTPRRGGKMEMGIWVDGMCENAGDECLLSMPIK